jgi:hypothetical protein
MRNARELRGPHALPVVRHDFVYVPVSLLMAVETTPVSVFVSVIVTPGNSVGRGETFNWSGNIFVFARKIQYF